MVFLFLPNTKVRPPGCEGNSTETLGESEHDYVYICKLTDLNKLKRTFTVSREAEVLHRWESKKQTFGFIN